jgi:hypothetical protein
MRGCLSAFTECKAALMRSPDEGLAEINAAVAELRPRVVRLSQSKK